MEIPGLCLFLNVCRPAERGGPLEAGRDGLQLLAPRGAHWDPGGGV